MKAAANPSHNHILTTPNTRYQKIAFALLAASPVSIFAADSVTLASPDQRVSAKVSIQNKELVYQLQLAGKTVLEDSRLGVTVDGADLGSGIKDLKAGEITEHKESYHLNGDESLLKSHAKHITITAEREGEPLVIELRARRPQKPQELIQRFLLARLVFAKRAQYRPPI